MNSLNGLAIGFAKKIVSYMKKAKLSTPKGLVYRLPTEAEWEYACLAGSNENYSFGDDENDLYKYANFADASLKADDGTFYYAAKADDGVGRLPAPVGSYLPNAWGIHDMHGNVSEYCKDLYVPKLPDGTDPLININKVNIVFEVVVGAVQQVTAVQVSGNITISQIMIEADLPWPENCPWKRN